MSNEYTTGSLDELVDNLLRDKDYLLEQELKQRVAELNNLLHQAHQQGLRFSMSTSADLQVDDIELAHIELKILKGI